MESFIDSSSYHVLSKASHLLLSRSSLKICNVLWRYIQDFMNTFWVSLVFPVIRVSYSRNKNLLEMFLLSVLASIRYYECQLQDLPNSIVNLQPSVKYFQPNVDPLPNWVIKLGIKLQQT